jgi:hypothetical protein
LKFAEEPALEDRILEVLRSLPVNFEKRALRQFARRCADRRNDISHFGGPRSGAQDYGSFLREVVRLSEALSYLYHAVLLHYIGVKDQTLKTCFYKHPLAHKINWALKEAGLAVEPPETVKGDVD